MNLMTSQDYCESLREYNPTVYVRGDRVESVADHPQLAPGVNAIGMTYDFAKTYRTPRVCTRRTAHIGPHGKPLCSHQSRYGGPAVEAGICPRTLPIDWVCNALSDHGRP